MDSNSQNHTTDALVGQDQPQANHVPRLPLEVLEMIWKAYCPAFCNDSRIVHLILKIYYEEDPKKFIHIFPSEGLVIRMRQLWHIMAINKTTRQRALELFPHHLTVRHPHTKASGTIRLKREIDIIMFLQVSCLSTPVEGQKTIPADLVLDSERSFRTAFQERFGINNAGAGEVYYPSDQVLDACRPAVSLAMRPPIDSPTVSWTISFLQLVTPVLFPHLETAFLCHRIKPKHLTLCTQELSWCVSGQVCQETLVPWGAGRAEPLVACSPNLQKHIEFANTHMSPLTDSPKPPSSRIMAHFLKSRDIEVWPMVIYEPRLTLPGYLWLVKAQSHNSH